jgi:hypothetical protein
MTAPETVKPTKALKAVTSTAYTAKEVSGMSTETLLAEFTRITGHAHLACEHCHSITLPLSKFVYAIQKRCGKKGIIRDMKLPATCDVQLKKNEDRNKIENSINNYYYPRIRNATTEEEIRVLRAARVLEVAAAHARHNA